MLFRPEEIHLSSSSPGICCRDRKVPVANHSGRVGCDNFTVAHLDTDVFVTVKARTIDTHRLTREQPANCQRIRTSNTEPFILAIY
jgi:hypothetical protein